MNDMAVERKLYVDTDSEEQVSIDDENVNLPPHQEPSSGSEDIVDEENVEAEDGTWQTGSNKCGCCTVIQCSTTCAGNCKYYAQFRLC
jgi:hypothetical protein